MKIMDHFRKNLCYIPQINEETKRSQHVTGWTWKH
jgi:hypothetical protein